MTWGEFKARLDLEVRDDEKILYIDVRADLETALTITHEQDGWVSVLVRFTLWGSHRKSV